MTLPDYALLIIGAVVGSGWTWLWTRPDRLSDDAMRLAGQRYERERGSYADRERLRGRT